MNAAEWFNAQSFQSIPSGTKPLKRDDAPRVEARAPGWFLVFGDPSGPIGVFGQEAAERRLAEILNRCL